MVLRTAEFECRMSKFAINLLLPEGSSYWLGLARATIFSIFVLYNMRKTAMASRNDYDAAKAMILPMLIKLIYAYIALNLLVAIVGIATYDQGCEDRFKGVFLALQMGCYHTLLEGLAFYLMRYGTGWRAVRDSLICGFIWGIVTFIIYFVQMTLFCDTYTIVGLPIERELKRQMWVGVSCGYNSMLFVFYATFLVVPITWLYRRPALKLYARFQSVYQLFWIITSVLVYQKKDQSSTVCVLSAFAIALMVFIHPAITYFTLQLDSQYWQGLVPEEGNPLADVWGSVGIATATSMARGVAELEKTRTVKLLHFGLLELDSKLGFVPGGFSRVYFGTLRGREHVAVKVIYSIELSPFEIAQFCREAKILDKLRHENIVHCHGVCVMPPALALIFENCKYGSLFNFLYVARFTVVAGPDTEGEAGLSLEALTSTHPNPNPNPNPNPTLTLTSTHHSNATLSPLAAPDHSRAMSVGHSSSAPKHTRCVLVNGVEPALPHAPSSNLLKLSSFIPQEAREVGSLRDLIPVAASSALGSTPLDQMEIGRGSAAHSFAMTRNNTTNTEIELSPTFSHDGRAPPPALQLPRRLSDTLSWDDSISLMLDAASAIAFMHSRGLLHCDIKSLNFLVCDVPDEVPPPPPPPSSPRSPTSVGSASPTSPSTKKRSQSFPSTSPSSSPPTSGKLPGKTFARTTEERGTCKYMLKLADMGEARTCAELEAMSKPPVPSRNWAPPEVLVAGARAEAYTASSDVFGLALVISEIALLSLPFGQSVDSLTQEEWLVRLQDDSFRPTLPASMHPTLQNMLRDGWRSDPAKRCTAADMVVTLRSLLELD